MNNIAKIRIYTSTPNILNINLNIINCVKMAYTCDYCKRSNIVNLSRHYGYCAVVDRMLDVSSGNLMGVCDSSSHSNQSIGTRPTPLPREKSDVEQSVPTDDLRRKRKINIESVASSRSPSPTLSSNNCILPQNSSCDDFSSNEKNNIISEFPEYSSFSDDNFNSHLNNSSSISSSDLNLNTNTTSSRVYQPSKMYTSNLGINPMVLTNLLSRDIGSDLSSNEDDHSNDSTSNPDTSLLHKMQLHNSTHQHQFNISQQSELKLYQFLQKIKAPLYAYDELMSSLSEISMSGHTFDVNFTSRKCLIEEMKNRYGAHGTLPVMKKISLERGNVIEVVTFDFLEMLRSLLTDPQCMQDENLTFPCNDPLQGPRTNHVRNEIHTGSWYKDAWKRRCTHENDFLLALPIFIDSSNTDVLGKNKIEPVQFTLSMFNRDCRRNFMFWRPLGFINDLTSHKLEEMIVNDSIAVSQKKLDSASNLRDYHRILSAIFESVKIVQEMGGFHFNLYYQNRFHQMVMKPVIGPIIGDNEGQDKLVARFQTFGKCKRLCRYCDISFENSDDPSFPFEYIEQNDIVKLLHIQDEKESTSALKEISYHYVPNNVFHTLDMGGDPRGIHGICPAEVLHTLRLGIFKYAVQCLIQEELYDSKQKLFDSLVKKISISCSHQSDRDVPRTNFQTGISSFTKITGNECSGVVLVVTMCLLCTDGKAIFESSGISIRRREKFIQLFEHLLMFEEWMCKETGFDNQNELSIARDTTFHLLNEIKDTLQRQSGNEMKLLKFHVLRHLIDDIERFGCAQNFNGGPCEENFKPHKHMAQLTQRRQNTFIQQIGHRLAESYCFKRAISEFGNSQYINLQKNTSKDSREIGGSRFIIQKSETDHRYTAKWSSVEKKVEYPQDVLKFVYDHLYHSNNYPQVMCFTEHKRDGVIFHGDCEYRSGHEWYDWVVINWEGHSPTIGKIFCFVDMNTYISKDPVIVNGNEIHQGQVYAAISSLSSSALKNYPGSVLFCQGLMYLNNENDVVYYLVSVDTIVDTAFVVNNVGGPSHEFMVMHPRRNWSSGFFSK